MNLVVHIPHRVAETDSSALSLAQRAPIFTVGQMSGKQVDIAQFPSLPESLDGALQLIGEAIRFPGAWASVNGRPVSSLAKLWQRLECYRESLVASDPVRHCAERRRCLMLLSGVTRIVAPCLVSSFARLVWRWFWKGRQSMRRSVLRLRLPWRRSTGALA